MLRRNLALDQPTQCQSPEDCINRLENANKDAKSVLIAAEWPPLAQCKFHWCADQTNIGWRIQKMAVQTSVFHWDFRVYRILKTSLSTGMAADDQTVSADWGLFEYT